VVSAYKSFEFENACVVFREDAAKNDTDNDKTKCKAKSSIDYMLKKAMGREGLDLVAVRMLYVNDANLKKH